MKAILTIYVDNEERESVTLNLERCFTRDGFERQVTRNELKVKGAIEALVDMNPGSWKAVISVRSRAGEIVT